MNESELIAASQKGNLAAFNDLVLAYQEQVYHTAYRLLGKPEMAEDATQEAFLSAWQGIRGFRGGSFRVWLLRIVTNAAYDLLRHRARRPAVSLEAETNPAPTPSMPEEALATSARSASPEEAALRDEVQAEVQRGLQTLPAEQRIVLILSDIQGLSYDEIAAVTNTNLGTVKSRLSRARAALRDYLAQRELLPSVQRHKG